VATPYMVSGSQKLGYATANSAISDIYHSRRFDLNHIYMYHFHTSDQKEKPVKRKSQCIYHIWHWFWSVNEICAHLWPLGLCIYLRQSTHAYGISTTYSTLVIHIQYCPVTTAHTRVIFRVVPLIFIA